MTPSPSTDRAEIDGVAAVIVLAAGGGTRMKSTKSKLLHEVAGRPMLSWAIGAARRLNPEHLVVVVGHRREQVEAHLAEDAPDVTTAVQAEQKGTGHAVACGLEGLDELHGEVVVTYGDVPMLTGETLQRMVEVHRERRNLVTVLTAEVEDPTGYGRILREGEAVVGIVEHKDADEAQRAVREINSGIYVFDAEALREGVSKLSNDNVQGEYYLTDVVTMAAGGTVEVPGRGRVGAFRIDDVWQTEGVNDRVQLARMNAEVNRRIVTGWMRAGVTIIDPTSTWIQPDVDLANDVTLYPGVFLNGATTIGAGATVGPDVAVTDSEIREEATVTRSEVTLAVVGEGVRVGPFSNIRPGSVLDRDAKVGAFVETKNTHIGTEAAIPHMAYVGDSEVTAGSSIVAGSVLSRECAAPATVSDITSDSQDDTLNPEADQ